DGRTVDVTLPVADRPDRFAALLVDDLEHPARARVADPLVLRLALDELLLALGAAEVLGHGRVAEEPAQQRQVAVRPGFESHTHVSRRSYNSVFVISDCLSSE